MIDTDRDDPSQGSPFAKPAQHLEERRATTGVNEQYLVDIVL
jgi:hypothetical protein